MTDKIATANAEADQSSVDNTNISVADLAARRLGGMTQGQDVPEIGTSDSEADVPEDATAEVPEEETEESVETEETEGEATEETEGSEDVLSQLDLDEMSEDDLRELADKLGSRAVARFGELTAKRKAAEERLAQMEAKLQEKPNPLETKKVDNNPYGNLDSVDKLQSKAVEVEQVVEWAEDILFESDGYAADDIVTEVEGKEWTKKDVRQALLKARKAQKTYLPDQLNKVQAQIQGEQLAESFSDRARQELSWLEGEDNDLRKQFEATVGDDRFKKLKKVIKREAPEVAAQLDYWFAHATNSIYGRKPVETKKASPVLNPSKMGTPSSAKPEKTATRTAKAIKELEARFRESGSARDFAELRKLKMGR